MEEKDENITERLTRGRWKSGRREKRKRTSSSSSVSAFHVALMKMFSLTKVVFKNQRCTFFLAGGGEKKIATFYETGERIGVYLGA